MEVLLDKDNNIIKSLYHRNGMVSGLHVVRKNKNIILAEYFDGNAHEAYAKKYYEYFKGTKLASSYELIRVRSNDYILKWNFPEYVYLKNGYEKI